MSVFLQFTVLMYTGKVFPSPHSSKFFFFFKVRLNLATAGQTMLFLTRSVDG